MPSPLEKARLNPDSMKAKILAVARKLFGDYGYNGTTTRMIAGKWVSTSPPSITTGVKSRIFTKPSSPTSTKKSS